MLYIRLTPKPMVSFAEMFGKRTIQKFFEHFADGEGDEIVIDKLPMMTFKKELIS